MQSPLGVAVASEVPELYVKSSWTKYSNYSVCVMTRRCNQARKEHCT